MGSEGKEESWGGRLRIHDSGVCAGVRRNHGLRGKGGKLTARPRIHDSGSSWPETAEFSLGEEKPWVQRKTRKVSHP